MVRDQICWFLLVASCCSILIRAEQPSSVILRTHHTDSAILAFMQKHHLPGCSFAVSAQGQILRMSGYGFADIEARTPVTPQHRFRIASISKPITAAAVMVLVEQDRLELDQLVFGSDGILAAKRYARIKDKRVLQITVRHLLEHSAGWDREQAMDPLWNLEEIARKMRLSDQITPADVIEYMLRHERLQFKPGQQHAYSNLGYCILGRIIEEISGLPYAQFVQQEVFNPLGIHQMQLAGDTLKQRANEEVKYYAYSAGTDPKLNYTHENCYGWGIDVSDASGGWIASATDLLRFTMAFDRRHNDQSGLLLKDATIEQMLSPPEYAQGQTIHYGLGWEVEHAYYWHTGVTPGTFAAVTHLDGGICYAILFNARADLKNFFREFAEPLNAAIRQDLADYQQRLNRE